MKSKRRQQITMMLLAGLQLKEIAKNLGISPRTVDAHRAKIYERYEVNSRINLFWAVAARQEENEGIRLNPQEAL